MYFYADDPLLSPALTAKVQPGLGINHCHRAVTKYMGSYSCPGKRDNQSPDPVNAVTKRGF